MTPLENLRTQLEATRDLARNISQSARRPYVNDGDLVLQHGTVFELSMRRPPVTLLPKNCFYQSYRLSQRPRSKWIYCEGYAVGGDPGLAMHHAWVIHPDRLTEAVELAWTGSEKTAYLGIPFRREFVREMFVASGRKTYNVIDAHWARWPLLTGKVKLEDVIWRNNEETQTRCQTNQAGGRA